MRGRKRGDFNKFLKRLKKCEKKQFFVFFWRKGGIFLSQEGGFLAQGGYFFVASMAEA
jgi:hypothetical protein